jgi:hypothetical protein
MTPRLSFFWARRRDARGRATRYGVEAQGMAAIVVVAFALGLATALAIVRLVV